MCRSHDTRAVRLADRRPPEPATPRRTPDTAARRRRHESAHGDGAGGGGGSRTRVHECRDGVSTSLAGAFSLAHRPRVGRVRIASPEKSRVRPVGTRRPDPSPLSDATVPAADSPGVTGRLIQAASARERSSAVMVFRQFNEATGPRLAAPTAIGPCRNRFAPTGATQRSLLLMIPPRADDESGRCDRCRLPDPTWRRQDMRSHRVTRMGEVGAGARLLPVVLPPSVFDRLDLAPVAALEVQVAAERTFFGLVAALDRH